MEIPGRFIEKLERSVALLGRFIAILEPKIEIPGCFCLICR